MSKTNLDIIERICYGEASVAGDFGMVSRQAIDAARQEKDVLLIAQDVELLDKDLELMQLVLDRSDRHAVVSPRMPNGEFLVLAGLKEQDAACRYLLQASRIPFASPVCALVKGAVIRSLGFLNSEFETLAGSFVDFCLRINGFGFDSFAANHAFANYRGTGCGQSEHDKRALLEHYPYFMELVAQYYETRIDACDHFLQVLREEKREKPRILFELSNLLPFHCGTSEYQMALLTQFSKLYDDVYDIHVYTNHEGARYHQLEDISCHIHYIGESLGVYHLGICASQPFELEQQCFLNRHCLRIVYTMLDVILLRCNYLDSEDWLRSEVTRLGLEMCDGIIAISDFSRDDYSDFFVDDEIIQAKPVRRIYIATSFGDTVSSCESDTLPFEHYNLIVGNAFKHKALNEAIDACANTGENYIVIGCESEGQLCDNIYGYPTSRLKESFLNSLYKRCSVVVFPSLYEGFGLPIVIAIKNGKHVIAHGNDLNRELRGYLVEAGAALHFFNMFSEIPALVSSISTLPSLPAGLYDHTWEEVAVATESYIKELLLREIDRSELNRRWRIYNLLDSKIELAKDSVGFKSLISKRYLENYPIRARVAKGIGRMLSREHKS